jgi:Rieske Fe-S protein
MNVPPPGPLLSRRRFVKTFALTTACSTLFGKPWRATVLAHAATLTETLTATFQIRASDYPALAQPLGSVRLGVNPVRPDIEPFPDGDFWPLLINRGPDDEFYVLSSECKHASCVVEPYDAQFFGSFCFCHGSLYDIDGSIVTGPTMLPLTKYDFEFDGQDTLTIHVPGLGFATRAALVPDQPRLALSFDTHPSVQYQANFRQRVNDAWSVIPFALTQDGPVDQTILDPVNAMETMYVPRSTTSGFYAVSMVLAEV